MVEALQALCARLQSNREPLDPESFDRLLRLVSSMLTDVTKLCASTQALDGLGGQGVVPMVAAATYEVLHEAPSSTRAAVRSMLERHRPLVSEHAEAISVLNRIASTSRSSPSP